VPLTLIFIDIDHFRAFNREFGRKAGDDVLKACRPGARRRRRDGLAISSRDTIVMNSRSCSHRRMVPGAFNISEQVRQSIEALKIPAAKRRPVRCVDGVGGDGHGCPATRIGVGRARSHQGGASRAARSARDRRKSRAAGQSGDGGIS
jgi:GGDEF domain-containing protein